MVDSPQPEYAQARVRHPDGGITLSAGQAVSGTPVIDMKELLFTITRQRGTCFEATASATFSQNISTAYPLLSSWCLSYTNTRQCVKTIGLETWNQNISGGLYTVKVRVHLADAPGPCEDTYSGWVRVIALAVLTSAR